MFDKIVTAPDDSILPGMNRTQHIFPGLIIKWKEILLELLSFSRVLELTTKAVRSVRLPAGTGAQLHLSCLSFVGVISGGCDVDSVLNLGVSYGSCGFPDIHRVTRRFPKSSSLIASDIALMMTDNSTK